MPHKVSVILNILASHFLTGEQMKREVLVATFLGEDYIIEGGTRTYMVTGHFTRLNLTFSEAGFKSIRVRKCCVTLTRS
jgi:hypothetical protein